LEKVYLSIASVGIGVLLGSLPFSVWWVRWTARAEVRTFGDGNPGAINAWRAGGWRVGVPVLVLDVIKGGLPVALARFVFELGGWSLVPIALAPVLGHAFSPWLRFRGGKGIAATFGVWTALTFWVVPMTMGVSMAAIMVFQTVSAWTVMMAGFATVIALLLLRTEAFLVVAFALNLALLAWTHREELLCAPMLRSFSRKTQAGDD